jgi:hypothetical protein
LKISLLSLSFLINACVLPTLASSLNYTMSFTGGPYENNVQINFAPVSGSFSYNPNVGFSSFFVSYNGDIFDFTAAANAPTICTAVAICSPGTAAQEFQELLNYGDWSDEENSSQNFGVSGTNTLSLGNYLGTISAQAAGFSNFSATSPPAVGVFTIAEAPEPGIFGMLLATALFVLLAGVTRLRHAAKQSA